MKAMLRLTAQLERALSDPRRVPEAGRDLWRIFVDLSNGRSYGAVGPNPIAYAEIDAYCRLYRWPLQPQHIDVIRALDRAWMEQAIGGNATHASHLKATRQSISVAAFDAVFG